MIKAIRVWLLSSVLRQWIRSSSGLECLLRSRREIRKCRAKRLGRDAGREKVLNSQCDSDQGMGCILVVHPGGCLRVLSVYQVFPT